MANRSYPDLMRDYSDQIFNYLDKQLADQMGSKVKAPKFPVMDGCLRGLGDLMSAFGLSDPDSREAVYDKLKLICPKPEGEDAPRRTVMRCAVEIMAEHSALFADFLVGDVEYWERKLKEWAFSGNRDDHKAGWRAILTFYRQVVFIA